MVSFERAKLLSRFAFVVHDGAGFRMAYDQAQPSWEQAIEDELDNPATFEMGTRGSGSSYLRIEGLRLDEWERAMVREMVRLIDGRRLWTEAALWSEAKAKVGEPRIPPEELII